MCTALTYSTLANEQFFGRTMDFSHPIAPAFYIVPSNYEWSNNATKKKVLSKYTFLGIGHKTEQLLAFFEGVNEYGLAAAALYFDGYADFSLPITNKQPIGSIDVVQFILSSCQSVQQVYSLLSDVVVVGIEDPITNKVAPLHWIVSDKNGDCAIIEQTNTGLTITPNSIGVLANSPTIDWHLTNLRNYMFLSNTQKQEVLWENTLLTPFSQGGGSSQLPGGFTSPERFVRIAFLKSHATVSTTEEEAVLNGFHLLGNVFIPKGVVITKDGTDDYTKYISVINLDKVEYYFKTYNNDQIYTVNLKQLSSNTHDLQYLGFLPNI